MAIGAGTIFGAEVAPSKLFVRLGTLGDVEDHVITIHFAGY